MEELNPKSKSVLITHVVNPHEFYFKFASDIGNSKFSNFDSEIQLYGNDLYAKKTYENGYLPEENELVIFFNFIYNKWIRGRVISIGREIVFWCIDCGIREKCSVPHVLPLTDRFQEDMKLVHLGGLSLLPYEKALNVKTYEVETHLAEQWDEKTVNLFKGIISKSKTFTFTTEFDLKGHKFGSLAIESKSANKENINDILLAMDNVAHSHQYGDEDLWSYVHKTQLKAQLYRSIVNGSSMQTAKVNTNAVSMISSSTENLKRSGDLHEAVNRQSTSDLSTIQTSETKTPPVPFITVRYKSPKSNGSRSRADISKDGDSRDSAISIDNTKLPSSLKQNDSDFLNNQCHLRKFREQHTKPVRQELRPSTLNWINSMNESKSSKNSFENNDSGAASLDDSNDGDHRSQRFSSRTPSPKNVPSTRTAGSRCEFAKLQQRKSASMMTKIVNKSSDVNNRLFGIPAGYAKNCLDTFGGLNRT